MKKQIDTLSAIPSKNIFSSIINDYNLEMSICELVDNAIDIWTLKGNKDAIKITIHLDKAQQTITVSDNTGGIRRKNFEFIIAPGFSSTNTSKQTIGIFGVGSKRAVVALAWDIKIKSRYKSEKTYQVEFDISWIESEEWYMPLFEVPNIESNTTIIELQKLRFTITDNVIKDLKEHLSYVYGKFLKNSNIEIYVNETKLFPKNFEEWAFPPSYHPRNYKFPLITEENKKVEIEIIAGLARKSSPAGGEYGVYFYCNNRLISKEQKDHHVGFVKGVAGKAHPSVSLT